MSGEMANIEFAITVANYIFGDLELPNGRGVQGLESDACCCWNMKKVNGDWYTPCIEFVPHCVEDTFLNGMYEYNSGKYLWDKYSMSYGQKGAGGLQAVWALVLHEMAHAVLFMNSYNYGGKREYMSPRPGVIGEAYSESDWNNSFQGHSKYFRLTVEWLQQRYPFDSLMELL